MLRIVFFLLISSQVLLSCDKNSVIQTSQPPCPDIEYFGLNCMVDLDEDDILGANGFHTFLYDNGLIKSEGNLTNGTPNGFWKFFYDNGHLKMEGNYTNGQLNGFWKVYWYNGNIREEGHYQHCERQGYWKFFYPALNNLLHHEGNYNQGKRVNQWKSYDETGTIIYNSPCFD